MRYLIFSIFYGFLVVHQKMAKKKHTKKHTKTQKKKQQQKKNKQQKTKTTDFRWSG